MNPGSGISPTANIQFHICAAGIDYRVMNGRISFLFWQIKIVDIMTGLRTTIVYLYEIEIKFLDNIYRIISRRYFPCRIDAAD